jgi:hypothetical protein
MNCTHQWADATTKAGPEWVCAHCKVKYSDTKATWFISSKLNPPKREWVGLTDDELNEWTPEIHGVIRTIEARLKEKNTWVGLTRWEIDAKLKEKNEM